MQLEPRCDQWVEAGADAGHQRVDHEMLLPGEGRRAGWRREGLVWALQCVLLRLADW